MLTRKFQLGFCGDWIEIYEQVPHPKDQGELFSLSGKDLAGRFYLFLWHNCLRSKDYGKEFQNSSL